MRKTIILSLVAAVFLFGMLGTVFAREAPKNDKHSMDYLNKPTGEPRYQLLNINNMWFWMESNGEASHSRGGDSGTYFPRGMVWCIYKEGIKWSGRCYTDADFTQSAPYGQRIRIGGNDYGSGTREGWVTGFGATAQAAPAGDDLNRIWKIRRDYASAFVAEDGSWTEDMKRDAAEYAEVSQSGVTDQDCQEAYDLYEFDWTNWPVDIGAPYIERNGEPGYQAPPPYSDTFTFEDLIPGNYDEPGIAGLDPNSPADQVVWSVYNDLDRSRTMELEGSEPIGLELQRSIWGYARTDAMGNLFFNETLIINKGGVDVNGAGGLGTFYIDSMYVAQWSDPDLGAFSDDLLACDTTLSMGYIYNGNAADREYQRYGQVVPAAGYDFLAGPLVHSDMPGARAVFNRRYVDGYVNLGMTGFSWFSAGSPISDPPSDYDGGLQWDKMFRGFQPLSGAVEIPYPFPPGVTPNNFPLAGNPVDQTGLLDGLGALYSFAPGDRRLSMSSGPFQMAPGDTQQVVVAFVAGQGSDRLSSISVMKFNDKFAQQTFDDLFQVPKPPAQPIVAFTEMDGQVLVEWGSSLANVTKIEETVNNPGGYTFEGYNIYQLPYATSSMDEAVRVATFDLPTDPTVILDEGFDPTSGQILVLPVQFGSNAGVQRFFDFDRDYVQDIDRIYNGQEYYLAVTAYSQATWEGYIPAALESPPARVTVIPHRENMGERYHTAYYDTLDATNPGTGDASVFPIVVDPGAVINATYTVEWQSDSLYIVDSTLVVEDDGTEWWDYSYTLYFEYDVKRGGTVVIADKDNYSLDDVYDIVNGIMFKVGACVFEAPIDYATVTVSNDDALDPAGTTGTYDLSSYGREGWGDPASSSAAIGGWGAGTTDLLLLQNDIELRFTGQYVDPNADVVEVAEGTGSIATFAGARNYDAADHPMNSTGDDYFTMRIPFEVWDVERDMQINIGIYDRIQLVEDVPFYAFNTRDRVYAVLNALPYEERVIDVDNVTSNEGDSNTWVLIFWEADWDYGDVITWSFLNKIQPGIDVYTVNTAGMAPATTVADAEADVERIQVYPNPYYAFNPSELSRLSRFVTFNNLPQAANSAVIRIFNLAGQLVAVVNKEAPGTFVRWDLLNHDGLPVASGMYIAHVTVTLPTGGEAVKVLKMAVIQEQEVLDVY